MPNNEVKQPIEQVLPVPTGEVILPDNIDGDVFETPADEIQPLPAISEPIEVITAQIPVIPTEANSTSITGTFYIDEEVIADGTSTIAIDDAPVTIAEESQAQQTIVSEPSQSASADLQPLPPIDTDDSIDQPQLSSDGIEEHPKEQNDVVESDMVIIKGLNLTKIPKPESKKQTSIQDYPQSITKNVVNKNTIVVAFPSDLRNDVVDIVTGYYEELYATNNKNVLYNSVGDDHREWVASLTAGAEKYVHADLLRSTVESPTAKFRQGVHNEVSNRTLAASRVRFNSTAGENLIGDRAVYSAIHHLGYGGKIAIPLWHSGFWMEFVAPSEAKYVALQTMLNTDDIEFGRASYGLLHGASVVYSLQHAVNFALEHCVSTSIKGVDVKDHDLLKSLISEYDVHTLLWGVATAAYPHGFNYSQACVANPGKCTHVINEILNVAGLQKTNPENLTKDQKIHMSSQQADSMSMESVTNYQKTLITSQPRTITVGDEGKPFNITLHVPTIKDNILNSKQWVDNIIDSATSILTIDNSSGREREAYYADIAAATSLQVYNHFIKSIEWGAEGNLNITSDPKAIRELLDRFSESDEMRVAIIDAIIKYINEGTISLIGIYSFDCPKCSGANELSDIKYPRLANIIPIDMLQTFFSMVGQRINQIRRR